MRKEASSVTRELPRASTGCIEDALDELRNLLQAHGAACVCRLCQILAEAEEELGRVSLLLTSIHESLEMFNRSELPDGKPVLPGAQDRLVSAYKHISEMFMAWAYITQE